MKLRPTPEPVSCESKYPVWLDHLARSRTVRTVPFVVLCITVASACWATRDVLYAAKDQLYGTVQWPVTLPGDPSAAKAAPAANDQLAAVVESMVHDNSGFGAVQLSITAVSRGLEHSRRLARGHVQAGQGVIADEKDGFWAGSATQAIVAALVVMFADSGSFALDDKLRNIENGGFALSLHQSVPGWSVDTLDITVLQLMQHTSGLGDYWDEPQFRRDFAANSSRMWKATELLSAAARLAYPNTKLAAQGCSRPTIDSAQCYAAAATNYILLGLLIEHVAHEPLQKALRSQIFAPMQMLDTYLGFFEAVPDGAARWDHFYNGNTDLSVQPSLSAHWASAGLWTSTRDMERFVRALVGGSLGGYTLVQMQRWMHRAPASSGASGLDVLSGSGLERPALVGGPLSRFEETAMWGRFPNDDRDAAMFFVYSPQCRTVIVGTSNQRGSASDWTKVLGRSLRALNASSCQFSN